MHGLFPRPNRFFARVERMTAGVVIRTRLQLRLRLLQQTLRGAEGVWRSPRCADRLGRTDRLASIAHLLHRSRRAGVQQQDRNDG